MGGFARRRVVSASLRRVAARCGAMGQAAASRHRSTARLSGASGVIGLVESLARPLLRMLDRDEGVINRLGFNSEGAAAVLRRLTARANKRGIVGVNIGANRDSADRIADYVRLIEI